MITNTDITIFNKRVDADRREVFIPTTISGVFWRDVRYMKSDEGRHTSNAKFIIRIPYDARVENNRKYISENEFCNLSKEEIGNYWTIQLNSYILRQQYVDAEKWKFDPFSFRSGVIVQILPEKLNEIRKFNKDFAIIVEYANNTTVGSNDVKHWRIGGA